LKVIIVDDEPAHVRGITKYVHWDKLGYDKVIGSFSANEALELIKHENFDLVITDISMPEINGLELIRRINTLGNKPDIIIVSGYNEFSYAQEAISLGVCAYILKPIKPEEIEESILVLIEKKMRQTKKNENGKDVDLFNESDFMDKEIISIENIRDVHPSVQKILLYIDGNYSKEITVHELAEQFRINESYLSALFKKEVGINLSNYIQKYRMYKAAELLQNSDFRVNEIAYMVGYQNPCYFTKQFKKTYNYTPSEMKKNMMMKHKR